jgi:predicted 2-oxoglutarate/Fe(II)-dependent dioxygenase YbiX
MVSVCIHSHSAQAYRDNGRIAIDSQELARALWMNAGIRDIMNSVKLGCNEALGLNSNIRFYRYGKGQRFGRHVDESVEAFPDGVTKYTLLIYLSDLMGGETVFYNHRGRQVVAVCPKPGRVLLHRHGDECLEHEALPVVEGTKYVLRSDVIFPS